MSARTMNLKKVIFALGLGGAGVLAAGGCANIIGVSDLESDEEPGSGGGLIGGSGGSSWGKGGSGGSGGDTGGKGGTGGQAPGTCGSTLEPNEDLVQSCLLYESCYLPTLGISNCVTLNLPGAFAGRACANGAVDCVDIGECRHRAYVHPGGPVSCAAGDMGTCTLDNYAVNCDNANTPQYTDCTLQGGECQIASDGWADCMVVESCTEADNVYSCSGDDLYYCFGGVGYGLDCTTLAAQCDGVSPDVDCYYSVTSCMGDSATCSGDTGIECSAGERYSYNCGDANLGCTTEDPYIYCLADGCTTDDWIECGESCSGSELTFCYGGASVTVDCQDYGFTTCREDAIPVGDGTSMLPVALCTF